MGASQLEVSIRVMSRPKHSGLPVNAGVADRPVVRAPVPHCFKIWPRSIQELLDATKDHIESIESP